MIILRKLNANYLEKTILPGSTEKFFAISTTGDGDAYDWHIKTVGSVGYNITKITSLYFNDSVEFTKYALIGARFNLSTDIHVLNGSCSLSITNNEQQPIRCIVKVKTF